MTGDRTDVVGLDRAPWATAIAANVVPIAYDQPFTYDILPDSDSGAYFAASVLIGSTLAAPAAKPLVSFVKE